MDVITETSLEALIQRATDPRNKSIDNAAVEAFCGIVKKMPLAAYVASKLVASKMQSTDEWEAVQGLSLLDSCMRKCGPSFHSEVGKFRFLNEMIKLVSPKFLGDRTSPKVRDTVLGLLHSWTISYPHETKIREAYEMLKKQGVIIEPVNTSSAFCESKTPSAALTTPVKPNLVLDQEFEKKLQKLLNSKNAQDLEAANRMIKSRVLEAERLTGDVERIRNNIRLLVEMLENRASGDNNDDDNQLITELYGECEKLRPTVFKLAAEVQDSDMLTEVLNLSEEMQQAFIKYDSIVTKPSTSKPVSSELELLDLSSPKDPVGKLPMEETSSQDLLGDALNVLRTSQPSSSSVISPANLPLANFDQLSVIFGSVGTTPLASNNVPTLGKPASAAPTLAEKSSKQKALEELDVLGESLLQQCKMENTRTNKLSTDEPQPTDDLLLDAETPKNGIAEVERLNGDHKVESPQELTPTISQVQPLTDISVTLESIRPSNVPPLKILDSNGVAIILNIADDSPRPDVVIYVVTTTSTSKLPLTDYLFQVVVPKGCKFKLQSPSSRSLPAHNPFLPAAAITQILLIANPNRLELRLTFILSFTMEGETVTEVGEVEKLPSLC